MRSRLVVLDLKEGKLYDSEKEESKTFHKLHVLGMIRGIEFVE